MRRFTISVTRNGWLVSVGEVKNYNTEEVLQASWSFNSLDRAVAKIRELMKASRQTPVGPKPLPQPIQPEQ